jgi:hypothetical protein
MITITLTPQTPVQISAALKFLEQLSGSAFVETSPQVESVEQKVEPKKRKAPAAEPAQEAVQAAAQAVEPAPETAAPATPSVTLEQVRAKLAALSHEGKGVEVKALLTKYGASKLTAVAVEQYAALLADAEEL